jgi:pimeloyl-ACP methyl ester carboxylesterase
MSPYWAWVQPEVAKTTRVCAYDRAGRAWSEPSPQPPDLTQPVRDLHTLLQNANIGGPYVLVGHSIGGLYVRQFAADYPDEVAGIVLLDAAHPEQYIRQPELLEADVNFSRLSAWFAPLAHLGVFRLYFATGGEIDFQDLPPRQHAEVAAFWSSPVYFRSQQAETSIRQQIYAEARKLTDLDDLPLMVVSAGKDLPPGWPALQAELAQLSTNSIHQTVDGATHVSLIFNPQDAQRTSAAIQKIIEAASSGQPLQP